MSRRLARWLPAVFSLTAIGLLALVPAASAARPKPHLDLVHVTMAGKRYAVAGSTVDLKVLDTVKNVGSATAGESVNELIIRHQGVPIPSLGHPGTLADLTRKVPSLKPGKANSGAGEAKIAIPGDTPLGAYKAWFCVDARNDV